MNSTQDRNSDGEGDGRRPQMPRAREPLSPNARAVCMEIRDERDGKKWRGIPKLAFYTGLDEEAVCAALKEAYDYGYVGSIKNSKGHTLFGLTIKGYRAIL